LYDRDAVVARFNQPNGDKIAAMIDAWRARGREVILAYGTNGGKLALPHYSLEPIGAFALDVPQWAFSYAFMPRSAWRVNLNFTLYRAVPQDNVAPYPLTIDFADGDEPALVSGFIERPTGATTRWIGVVPDAAGARPTAKRLTATLRLPDSNAESFDLTINARAPQDGMQLSVRSGNKNFGEETLTREFASYHFTLARANLKRDGDTFLIDLTTSAVPDAEGRVLGAELKSARVEIASQ
jgi:hypothetical protein